MVRKLIIRIAKDEAGESNFSNLSSEELNEIRTEIIRVLYVAKFLNGVVITQMTERVIILGALKEGIFHLKRGAEIADELSRKYLIKEFNYKAEYDPVTQEEPSISIEIDGE